MPKRRRVWIALFVALAAVAAVALLARPPVPGAFYDAPASLPSSPGRLIRVERYARNVPAGANAWRILYTTTRADGAPAVASGIVMTAATGSNDARPVIAWAHGTTGIEPGCAPGLLAPFANVPALEALLRNGWIYVATDYVGLGTRGPHPYLIGEGEARSVLDAVRAAREMAEVHAAPTTVVWGHSQGGHAALWTGIVAPRYAPDVPIAGVAAAAPASDLRALIARVQGSIAGRLTTSYVLHAYHRRYGDVSPDEYSAGGRGALSRTIAGRCLSGGSAVVAVAAAVVAGGSVFTTPPTEGALGRRLLENTPARAIAAPVFIAQGLDDDLVLPDVQDRFVAGSCAAQTAIRYVRYRGRDHLSLVAPGSPYVDDLVRWTQARIRGAPADSTCATENR